MRNRGSVPVWDNDQEARAFALIDRGARHVVQPKVMEAVQAAAQLLLASDTAPRRPRSDQRPRLGTAPGSSSSRRVRSGGGHVNPRPAPLPPSASGCPPSAVMRGTLPAENNGRSPGPGIRVGRDSSQGLAVLVRRRPAAVKLSSRTSPSDSRAVRLAVMSAIYTPAYQLFVVGGRLSACPGDCCRRPCDAAAAACDACIESLSRSGQRPPGRQCRLYQSDAPEAATRPLITPRPSGSPRRCEGNADRCLQTERRTRTRRCRRGARRCTWSPDRSRLPASPPACSR